MNVAVVGAIASRACSKPKLFRLVVSDKNKQTNKQMEKNKKWTKIRCSLNCRGHIAIVKLKLLAVIGVQILIRKSRSLVFGCMLIIFFIRHTLKISGQLDTVR